MIHFNRVSKKYQNHHKALIDISFCLKQGEMAFLTGPSGAGKSTLLKLIALIERPSMGDITIRDQNIARLSKRKIPHLRRQIGLIFQNPQLLPNHSVFENVAMPLNIAGYHPNEIKSRARAALDKVGLLNKEKKFPNALSCGEQQRIGIARAIITKPSIILADEPTGNLDPKLAEEIMQMFLLFNQLGSTVLIASHNINLIQKMHHRILTLQEGRLIEDKGEKA